MNAGIGIGILFILCIVAVIATIVYMKPFFSGPSEIPETVKINADGTLTFTESKKEYFFYPENGHGTTYTEDDPVHMRYYKNKATRVSIWNVSKDILKTPCDEPDCVFVNSGDKETTTVLLNDIMDSLRPGLTDYRNYLHSKGINIYEYKKKAGEKSEAEAEKFSFDILFMGYLEYKGIAVPPELSVSWSEMFMSEYYRKVDSVIPPIAKHWTLFHKVLMGGIGLKEKSDGKTVLYVDGRENHLGINIGIDMGILLMAFTKSLVENKDIVNILYDPPPVTLSYKQIKENMKKLRETNE
jgi:hypothetical protein